MKRHADEAVGDAVFGAGVSTTNKLVATARDPGAEGSPTQSIGRADGAASPLEWVTRMGEAAVDGSVGAPAPVHQTTVRSHGAMLYLQRSAGNAAVSGLLHATGASRIHRMVWVRQQNAPPRPITTVDDAERWLGRTLNPNERKALEEMLADQDERFFYADGEQQHLLSDINARVEAVEAHRTARAQPPKHILVQGDYMSGDRFGIAAALLAAQWLKEDLGVLLMHAPGNDATAKEMKTFYENSCELGVHVKLMQVQDPKACYRLLRGFEDEKVHLATFGTEWVKRASKFTQGHSTENKIQEHIVRRWRGEPEEAKRKEHDLEVWLCDSMKLTPGAYAFLWVKTGAMNAEKAHHFTNKTAWAALIETVKRETGRTPVLVGDDIGLRTNPHLGKFWEHPQFPRELLQEGRIGQLRLFMMLARHPGYDIVNVGMRSGALEAPALVGVPTIYLEESGNEQAGRMEKWLAVLPNYYRVIIDRPPGGKQLRAWKRRTVQSLMDRLLRLYEQWSQVGPGRQRGVIEGKIAETEHALTTFDELLRQSMYEGLQHDEVIAITGILKQRGKALREHEAVVAGHPRRRLGNRPEDKVAPFDPSVLTPEDNPALEAYDRFRRWLDRKGLSPVDMGAADELVKNLAKAVASVGPAASTEAWKALGAALQNARQARLHGRLASGAPSAMLLGSAIKTLKLSMGKKGTTPSAANATATFEDLVRWMDEGQPAGRHSHTSNHLLLQLVSELAKRPATRAALLAKWQAVDALLRDLNKAGIDGPTALRDRDVGWSLHEESQRARLEMFTADDLPAPAPAQPTPATTQTPALAGQH